MVYGHLIVSSMYISAVNSAETTIRYVVYFTNSTLFHHDDHFRQYDVIKRYAARVDMDAFLVV